MHNFADLATLESDLSKVHGSKRDCTHYSKQLNGLQDSMAVSCQCRSDVAIKGSMEA